ncbi:MAG: hypothetical protein A3K18_15270 [Lentisphaerae bacterium RIFOXYA12_64_32]|nr:MAG: hypothetical protein A3K18_15270 [Lentisphaerae bacterium RIFOXYA12_64_32]
MRGRRVMRNVLGVLGLASWAVWAADGPGGPKKHAEAVRLDGTLTIDGKLDDAVWQKAPLQTGFEKPLGLSGKREPIPDDAQTEFRVMYDDDTLYFGVTCKEPKMSDLRAVPDDVHDAAMWSDDDLEIFLDPVGDRMEYYQFAINSRATKTDLYMIEGGNTGKGGWSSDWQAAVFKGADFWSLEVAIPFGTFHNRPSSAWSENWVFSMSRTRTPAPAYWSMYSPGNGGYHNISNFGDLGQIRVDKARFNLYAEAPKFVLEPEADGYRVSSSLLLENRGDTPFAGTLEMNILASKARGASQAVNLDARKSARIDMPPGFVKEQGKLPAVFRVVDAAKRPVLVIRFDTWMTFTPLAVRLTQPNYRNCIFATQSIETLKGVVRSGLPLDKVQGCTLKVTVASALYAPRSVEIKIETADVPFELAIPGLPEGRHTVRAEVLRPIENPKPGGPKADLVAEAEIVLRKLPRAPAVEARIDDQGNLLVNGEPVFPRGWYGSMSYCVAPSSFPQAQLPHSTNFMMGASAFEQSDLNLYTLSGLTTLGETQVDRPLNGEEKAKIRAQVAAVRNQRNVLGYYISDEPECRGISPVFLKSIYEFLMEEDPYRFCKIVSRSPAQYIEACDVMCPHPYMAPQAFEDGSRKFSSFLRHIHNVTVESVRANDGSKALWSMPQTFSYGGLRGRHPNFVESRWFTHTAIACGAKGIVPFIFNGYWNHWENRVAMNYVFEELAFLAPVWTARDSAREATCANPDVDVIAKYRKPEGAARGHTFLVAANQSYSPSKATFTVPVLAENKNARLLVLRENRVVAVTDGTFADEFAGLGVHIYTTLEVLPDFRTLAEVQKEIDGVLAQPAKDGNLLGRPDVEWAIGEYGMNFSSDSDLADGVTDAGGWYPVYGDRKQCVVVFSKPVRFSRVVLHSTTIKAASLDIWDGKDWKTIHQWKDQFLSRLEWKGEKVTTEKVRIKPEEDRLDYGAWRIPEIAELGIYE